MSIKTSFDSTFFISNRQRMRELAGTDAPIVLAGNGLLQRSADTAFAFQQDSSFWYLTGIEEADILLVIDGSEEYLILPTRSGNREAFDGVLDVDMLQKISGVKKSYGEQEGWERLTRLIRKHSSVAMLEAAPPYIESLGMYTNPARRRLARRLLKLRPELELLDLRPVLASMRMVKQPPELAAIRQAIDITAHGLNIVTLPTNMKNYKNEYEIEADLHRAFRRTGGRGHAFSPIVASGKRGCTLHSVANNGPIAKNELVVIDVGAEVDHYAADITRTVCKGTPSNRQIEVFEAVQDIQRYALDQLKPGTMMRDWETGVVMYTGEKLKALGLIDVIEPEAVRKYYPHAVSHFMGLDVHDIGDYSKPLEPGIVLTCEPGIYIMEEGIGVRIEDDILITETGYDVLSAAVPVTITGGNA